MDRERRIRSTRAWSRERSYSCSDFRDCSGAEVK
jgi:hypothetical protein